MSETINAFQLLRELFKIDEKVSDIQAVILIYEEMQAYKMNQPIIWMKNETPWDIQTK